MYKNTLKINGKPRKTAPKILLAKVPVNKWEKLTVCQGHGEVQNEHEDRGETWFAITAHVRRTETRRTKRKKNPNNKDINYVYISGVARGSEGASAPGAKVGGAKMSKTFKNIFLLIFNF